MRGRNHIFFDLDGTLIDSSRGIYEAYLHACKNLNIKLLNYDIFKKNIGPPFEKMNKLIHPDLTKNVNLKIIENFREQYDSKSYLNYELYEGIKHCINKLKGLDFCLYVLTNKRDLQAKTLVNKEFKDTFLNVFGKKGRNFNKSSILKFYRSKYKNDKVMFVGDTIGDLKSALEASVDFVYASYGFGKIENKKNILECKKAYFLDQIIIDRVS